MDFRDASLPELATDVASRRTSARELVEHALARIAELNPRVNAFVAVDADVAVLRAVAVLEDALALDTRAPI